MTTPRFYARFHHGFDLEAKFTTPDLAAAAAMAMVPVLGYCPKVEVYVNGAWARYDLVDA